MLHGWSTRFWWLTIVLLATVCMRHLFRRFSQAPRQFCNPIFLTPRRPAHLDGVWGSAGNPMSHFGGNVLACNELLCTFSKLEVTFKLQNPSGSSCGGRRIFEKKPELNFLFVLYTQTSNCHPVQKLQFRNDSPGVRGARKLFYLGSRPPRTPGRTCVAGRSSWPLAAEDRCCRCVGPSSKARSRGSSSVLC